MLGERKRRREKGGGEEEEDEEDLGIFTWFAAHPEVSEDDEKYIQLIREILLGDGASSSSSSFSRLISLQNYRLLEGMIMRNAQQVHPVSDFVSFLCRFPFLSFFPPLPFFLSAISLS